MDLLWEQAIRFVGDEVIVSALDESRGDSLHIGHPLLGRLSQGDVDLVVTIGSAEEAERLGLIVEAQKCAFVALSVEHWFTLSTQIRRGGFVERNLFHRHRCRSRQ